jgi:hypothetical protein
MVGGAIRMHAKARNQARATRVARWRAAGILTIGFVVIREW